MKIEFSLFTLLKESLQAFVKDNAAQMAAALSYYALFAIPPILVLTLMLLNIFLSSTESQTAVIKEVSVLFGPRSEAVIRQVIDQITRSSAETLLTQVLSSLTLLVAATGILGHIQRSLNTLWHIDPKKNPFIVIVEQRVLGLIFIGVAGLFFLISVLANTALQIFAPYVQNYLTLSPQTISWLNTLVSFILISGIIALTFRFIPSARMAWKDIAVGSVVTAFLISLGKHAISFYIAHTNIGSAYGAAGSILVLLFWIYYSSLIFFFGAEFTYSFSQKHGRGMSERE